MWSGYWHTSGIDTDRRIWPILCRWMLLGIDPGMVSSIFHAEHFVVYHSCRKCCRASCGPNCFATSSCSWKFSFLTSVSELIHRCRTGLAWLTISSNIFRFYQKRLWMIVSTFKIVHWYTSMGFHLLYHVRLVMRDVWRMYILFLDIVLWYLKIHNHWHRL